jgi:biopolymer transport protein ExbB
LSIVQACGPVALPLLLVSIVVATVLFDRCLFWWQWWRQPEPRLSGARQFLRDCPASPERYLQLRRLKRAMAQGEPFLQAAVLVAPMLGLLGTVFGLMNVLRALGPQLLLPSSTPLVGYGDVLVSTVLGLQLSLVALVTGQVNRGLRHWQLQNLALLVQELDLRP